MISVIGLRLTAFVSLLFHLVLGICVSLNLNVRRHRPYANAGHLASWQSGIVVDLDGFGKSGQQDSLASLPWSAADA